MTGKILDEHVRLFNQGVRSHDFGPMLDHFSDDAEMYFEGIPVGPSRGRSAIKRAYVEQPPDDEIVVLSKRENPSKNLVVGVYAWLKEPKTRAGELKIETKADLIVK